MHDLFPSKYLRAVDLQGERRIVTIEKVTHEPFKDDGVNVTKTVIHFYKGRIATAPMVCNKTNWRMMVAITGNDDDDHWAGNDIELRPEKVPAPGGKIVDSIRIYEVPLVRVNGKDADEAVTPPKAKKAKADLPANTPSGVPYDFNDEVGF